MALSKILLCLLLRFTLSPCYFLPTQKDFINDNRKDWFEAESHCLTKYNSHLLSIHDSHSFQNLRNKIIAIGQETNHFWIGLINDNPSTIHYTWSDHTPFTFGTDLTSGDFPWFDERPESPFTDRYVRLWGGSASLLWDDTHHDNQYFWICNDTPSYEDDNTIDENTSNEPGSDSAEPTFVATRGPNTTRTNDANDDIETSKAISDGDVTSNTKETETNEDIFMAPIGHSDDASHLNTFWKFALFGILILTTCIILMRLRIMYRTYAHKRRASSIGIGPRQITDLSVMESHTSYKMNKAKHDMMGAHALPFSSIDQREDSLDLCNQMQVISPFSDQTGGSSSDDIAPVNELQMSYKQTMSLEIEYDVTSHNSVEGQQPNHMRQPGMVLAADSMVADSMAATFGVNSLMHSVAEHEEDMEMEEHRRSILLIMEQNDAATESYEDTSSCRSKENTKRSSFNSIHSTMAAFDAQSFQMKGDRDELYKCDGEYADGLMGNSAHTHSSASSLRRRGAIVNVGESIKCIDVGALQYVVSGETSDDCSETQIEQEIEDDDLPTKRGQTEIKSNISQIMENLKRMKNMSSESIIIPD
eukprot:263514_1